jgi:hypothetical protein
MRNKLHQQTDLLIYEEIASGRLNPRLPANSELQFLKNLVVFANTKTLCTCRIDDDPAKLIKCFDITELGYQFREDAEILVKDDTEQKVHQIIARPTKIYQLEDHFNLPDPPDKKSAYFLALISDEFERVKIRANKVLNSTCKKKHIALFAHKNIQRARKIQYDVRYMITKIARPWSSITDNPDAYVIFVLDIFLARTINFYQQLFHPFILAFPRDEQSVNTDTVTPLYISHPYLYRDFQAKQELYNLQTDGSIFDHQINNQIKKFRYITEPDSGYSQKTGNRSDPKKSFQQDQSLERDNRLKWHGQLNVLVDILLQLSTGIKVNGKPPLEATPDELRLFIRKNFLDKDGREISPFTLDTYLKPNRQDKRLHPESPKRIDMSGFFNSSES